MDEARLFANEPIKALGSIQTMFENQIVKVQQLIKEGFTGNNNEIAVRMEVAVLATQLGQEEIEKIDRNFGKLFNETQDKAKQYSKTAKKFETEKRQSKAEAYFNLANYKITINNLAIVEYLKERRLTFNIEEKLFKEIHKLKDLLQL
uniref:TolC family protein n=1 Tax=Meloidogyne hapla TaxID=6305 RepID=A0A1I8B677_MELHA